MKLNDYKKLPEYDFTEDWKTENEKALEKYRELPHWEKHFVYKMSNTGEKPPKVYEKALDFWKDVRKKYAEKKGNGRRYFLGDPDTDSPLLQEIYKELWGGNVLELCSDKNGQIHGDTMNSITTTMSRYIYHVFADDENYYRGTSGNGFVGYSGSRRQLLEIYLNEKKSFDTSSRYSDATNFIRINHTLGNFIPVPFQSGGGEFNRPRFKSTRDYWDLTLYYIYQCYEAIKHKEVEELEDSILEFCSCQLFEDNICKLLGNNCSNVKLCLQWLCRFRKDGKPPSWDAFVEGNYLRHYVSKNTDGSFGIPLLLWSNEPDIQLDMEKEWKKTELEKLWKNRIVSNEPNKSACEMFFKNARYCIEKRTELMLDELKSPV